MANMKTTNIYLEEAQRVELMERARLQTQIRGERVSMADLVRESIALFLASVPRETAHSAMHHVADTHKETAPELASEAVS